MPGRYLEIKEEMLEKIYANAIASYMSGRLLGIEKLRRLAGADFRSAVKMLVEYGYGGGISYSGSYDIDRFITNEARRLCAFVEETSPSDGLTRCLLNRFYYSDAKILYKSRYSGNTDYALVPGSEMMKAAFLKREYGDLPPYMRDTAKELDAKYAGTEVSAKEIDQEFTRAMHKDSLECAHLSGSRSITAYCRAQIDVTNILSAYRAKQLKMNQDGLFSELYEGGEIPLEHITKILSDTSAQYVQGFDGTPYEDIISTLEHGKTALYFKRSDELLVGILKEEFNKIASYGMFIRYFIEQILEFKAVKYILVCIKNGISVDFNARVWSFEL